MGYSLLKETIKAPELSEWTCYMFGSKLDGNGFVYTPVKGNLPNRFVRAMMKICFDCTWLKEK